VGEVLDNGLEYDKKPLADPLEPEYDGGSMTKAKFYWNDGKPSINSFAHGQIKYSFKRFQKAELPKKDARKLRLVSSSDLVLTPPRWVIKNHLEKEVTAEIYGASGTMKTFIVMDMGLSISTGRDWHGCKVEKSPVIYICGEGKANIKKRIEAWEKLHGIRAPGFYVSTCAARMLDEDSIEEIKDAVNQIALKEGQPGLLIIDTLNRNFGQGDENSTQDMTQYIQAVDNLKDSLKCTVLTVHHTGLGDATRGRGSSVLRGAMDFEYIVEKTGGDIEDQILTLTCTKAKDFDAPRPRAFRPVLIDLGLLDEDMRPVTSLALELSDEQPAKKRKKLSLPNQIALDALKALTVHGEDASETAWRQECYARGISTADKPDAQRKAFSRARTVLIENFYIQTRDEKYWLCRSKKDSDQPGQTGQAGQAGHVRTCPGLSTIGRPDGPDKTLKGCPVCPPMDAFIENEKGQSGDPAFQDFNETVTLRTPVPEKPVPPLPDVLSIPEVEPWGLSGNDLALVDEKDIGLTDAVYELDDQEDDDAIYI
jgi:hypothetical protein